jgi:hypothetical protein
MPYSNKHSLLSLLLSCMLFSSCYTYRLATHAQPATESLVTTKKTAHSLFWGLLNNPQVLTTPNCDAAGVNGVSEVIVRTNFGYACITVLTLGIYCPVTIEWKCSKPCAQSEPL